MLSLICFFPLFFSTLLICRFHNITHIPTAFSDNLAKPLYLLAKPYTIWQNHTFWQKSEVSPNCIRNFPIAIFTALSQNAKKRSPPATPVNPSMPNNPNRKLHFLFISSHFSILLPNRTQIPMASIIDSRLCGIGTGDDFFPCNDTAISFTNNTLLCIEDSPSSEVSCLSSLI